MSTASNTEDETLDGTLEVVRAAGTAVLETFDPSNRVDSFDTLKAGLRRNEAVSTGVLEPGLRDVHDAPWLPEEDEQRPLAPGEWWVVDAVEGNVNHLHGLPDWAVTAALFRDGEPVLGVVHQPAVDVTTVAIRDRGTWRNNEPLHVSTKRDLDTCVVATGQAEAGQTDTYEPLATSVRRMLERALLVRAAVPSTFPLLHVAAGHADGFWQYAPTLPGVAVGVLAVREAGGLVTDHAGQHWQPGMATVVAAAPAVHAQMIDALAGQR